MKIIRNLKLYSYKKNKDKIVELYKNVSCQLR